MQIWAESGKSALPICNYSQILYQFLTFTQNLKRSLWGRHMMSLHRHLPFWQVFQCLLPCTKLQCAIQSFFCMQQHFDLRQQIICLQSDMHVIFHVPVRTKTAHQIIFSFAAMHLKQALIYNTYIRPRRLVDLVKAQQCLFWL